MDLPEITEVQRLTLRPGDRLVIRTDQALSPRDAEELAEAVQARLGLGDDVPVIILDRGTSLEVLDGA